MGPDYYITFVSYKLKSSIIFISYERLSGISPTFTVFGAIVLIGYRNVNFFYIATFDP